MRTKKRVATVGWLFMLCCVFVTTGIRAGIDSLTVDPPAPDCNDTITLSMEGSFSDQCWTVQFLSFDNGNPDFRLTVVAVDSWEPGQGCNSEDVLYSIDRTVGPLSEGSYTLIGEEILSSVRVLEGDTIFLPFDVVCCVPTPSSVVGLKLEALPGGQSLRLTWADDSLADDYVVYDDVDPQGGFFVETGTAASGTAGLTVPMPAGDLYFLAVGRNSVCGEGPKR